MKYRWLHKNVIISSIEEAVNSFFEQRKFSTASFESKDSKKIVGVLRHGESAKKVIVTITGKPDDFIVDFFAGESARLMAKFTSLITFFGAGQLELRSLKEKEFYQKLEDEFWKYLEDFVAEQSHR